MSIDRHALARKLAAIRDREHKEHINEVAKTANDIQAQQPGLSRTEALRVAEIMVARANARNS